MWQGRRLRWVAVAVAAALSTCPDPARAADSSPGALAAAGGIAYAAAQAGARSCAATIDAARNVESVYWHEVSPLTPDGHRVFVDGLQGIHDDSFRSEWLVAGGVAYPQNIAAARLAARCRNDDFTPQTIQDWSRLSYLDPRTGEINAGSNPAWDGARFVRRLVPFVGETVVLEDPLNAVWAPSCEKQSQTVRFTRVLQLLGPPAELRAFAATEFRGFGKWPIHSYQLYVNGRRVAKARGAGARLDATIPPELVALGPNQFDFIVTKRRTKSCNKSRSPRLLGVIFALTGRQAWNLSVDRPPSQQSVGGALPNVPYTPSNAGPSYALAPIFAYQMSVFIRPSRNLIYGESGSGVCSPVTFGPGATGSCTLPPLGPGESTVVNLRPLAGPAEGATGPYRISWSVEWHLNGIPVGSDPGKICVAPAGRPSYCNEPGDDVPRP
jgi:hypothetical protein